MSGEMGRAEKCTKLAVSVIDVLEKECTIGEMLAILTSAIGFVQGSYWDAVLISRKEDKE